MTPVSHPLCVHMKGKSVSPSGGHREYRSPIRPRALENLSHTGQHSPSGTEKCSHPLSSSQRMSSQTTFPLSHTHSRQGSGFQMALGSWVTSPSLQPSWFSSKAAGREVKRCNEILDLKRINKMALAERFAWTFLHFGNHSLSSYIWSPNHNM